MVLSVALFVAEVEFRLFVQSAKSRAFPGVGREPSGGKAAGFDSTEGLYGSPNGQTRLERAMIGPPDPVIERVGRGVPTRSTPTLHGRGRSFV